MPTACTKLFLKTIHDGTMLYQRQTLGAIIGSMLHQYVYDFTSLYIYNIYIYIDSIT